MMAVDLRAAERLEGRRREVRQVSLVWAALFLNVLTFAGPSVLPIPAPVGQVVTQGALLVAVGAALVVNSRGLVRVNLFLVLLCMLATVSLMVSVHSEFMLGSTYRACRYLLFLMVLWLLTPWFGRRDMLLLRCHLRVIWVVLGVVLAGAAVAPGAAFGFAGRLSGVLWPIWPTQVAHYAAVLLGAHALLWACRMVTNRQVVIAVVTSGTVLVLTHTRTALLALLVGACVAGASLFLGHVRVRRTSALGAVVAVVVATVFSAQLADWVLRGQTPEEASQLTGRTQVWTAALRTPRTRVEEMFGSGVSNQSFNGLPIDSNWVATYLDQGWFGVVVHASVIVVLLLLAATRERGVHRAVGLFLVVYCLTASFTETGLLSATPYLLDMTVAAALLAGAPADVGGPRWRPEAAGWT